MRLSPRARLTYFVHLFKALTHRDHTELQSTFERLLGPDGIVVDVGGHAGQFTKLFSRIVPQGHVYVFEPGSYALSILRRVIRLGNLRNVCLCPVALGDETKSLDFHIPVKQSGSVGFGLSHFGIGNDNRDYFEEIVQQTTLDQFVVDNKIERINLIKADIEGWEGRMLAGACETLKRFKPTLYLELNDNHLSRAGDTVAGIRAGLTALGYEAWAFDVGSQTLRKLEQKAERNIFFIAPDKCAHVSDTQGQISL